MVSKVKSPNEKSYGFLWALVVVVVVIVVVLGYIIVKGQSDKKAAIEASITPAAFNVSVEDDGAIKLAADSASADTPSVDLYEDYSCHYCADLAERSDTAMKQAIEDGKMVVYVRSLNFLDRNQTGHSTLSGAAAYTLAEYGNAVAYWNLRTKLFDEQASIYGTLDNAGFADLAKSFGATGSVVDDISEGKNVERYLEVANSNSDKLEGIVGSVSSPHVIYDGQDISQQQDWVATVTG